MQLGKGEPTRAQPAPEMKNLSEQAAAMRETLAILSRKKKGKFLVDPRTSKKLPYWDGFVGFLLCYTAIATPYEVAFLPLPTTAEDARFVINRVIDMMFVLDMILQLFVMYPEPPAKVALDSRATALEKQGVIQTQATTFEMVTSHKLIALHYLRGWFLIDLLSVLTLLIDVIPVVAQDDSGSGNIDSLRIFRVLRVLRLIKLVRLLKTSRLLRRWQTSISIDFSTQTMIQCLCSYLLAGHWFTCILVGVTAFADSPIYTWRGAKGYCKWVSVDGDASNEDAINGVENLPRTSRWEMQPEVSASVSAHLASQHDLGLQVYCVNAWDLWAATYYWMIQLISGAAGGDTNQGDMDTGEYMVFTLLVVASCLLMSQIIASFCDVLSNMNPENTAFRNRMDHLNRYCRANRLASTTRRELREYLIRAKHVQIGESQRQLMLLMSPKLQGELSLQINGPWLTTIRFLRKIEVGCAIRIALSIKSAVYVPTELLMADSLYYIDRGTVVYRGNVLTGGRVWGEDCIISRVDIRSRPARALTYVAVSQIIGSVLIDIIQTSVVVYDKQGGVGNAFVYPTAVKKLRWERVRLSLIAEARLRLASSGNVKGRWDLALGSMELDLEKVKETEVENSVSPEDVVARKPSPFRRLTTGMCGSFKRSCIAGAPTASASFSDTSATAGVGSMLEVPVDVGSGSRAQAGTVTAVASGLTFSGVMDTRGPDAGADGDASDGDDGMGADEGSLSVVGRSGRRRHSEQTGRRLGSSWA